MTLGRLEKHYRVCLSADASGGKDAAAATLLHSQVRPTAVQGPLACGVQNVQSASAAREHLDRVYRTLGHRQATDGILKGISVCTGCVEAPEWPPSALVGTEAPGPELHGVPLAALKGQHPLGERRRPPPSLASLAAEDLVDMSTDDLKERYKRTVTMAGMMAYTLTEDREEELPAHGRVDDDQEEGVGVAAGMLRYVRYVRSGFLPPNAPLELLPVVLRVRRVIHVAEVMLPDVPPGVIILVPCVFVADGSRLRGRSEHNPVASATPVWVPPSPAPGPAPPPPPSPLRTPPSAATPTPTADVGAGAGAVRQDGAGVGARVGLAGQARVRGTGRSGRGMVGAA